MRLAFSIAYRFLKSGKSQTLLIILGISIGVSVQVFLGSLIGGLQTSLIDSTIGSSPQITVLPDDETSIKEWERVVYEAEISSDEIINIAAAADGTANIEYGNESDPVLVRGFNIEDGDRIYKFSEGLMEGRLPGQKDEAIIGMALAETTDTGINDRILVTRPDGNTSRLTVTGFFDLQVASINESWIVTNLETAQDILYLDKSVTSVEMQTTEVFEADNLARILEYTISDDSLKVENWKDRNRQLLSGLNSQSVSSYMIQAFVLIAVLLGIASVLAISAVQKSKQLGILKAMGIRDRSASMIFIFQGFILGVAGALIGIMLGFVLLYIFTTFAVNPDGSPVVPIYVNIFFIALSGLFAVSSAVIASLIPARISSRLNPIEVIRNG
ncbi:lipoprotein-releasing system permease protein [Dethiosulfatibacter aminovorans DSM 17477]|uniref:Lipoprotein-releasing system permease protein n=1 Tax=Dethiosulfatibacter aminovorans DSM 17477 TaxID=1121476 RepID=A0A1M6HD93_9FIRM|nr:ABC transporter permease [Dethiosulfatibacter aminovorans]SHJ20182.1 lipoprotein-releasing system permease protein [Dethiosulfatibacter aminovorans DSM 17477]